MCSGFEQSEIELVYDVFKSHPIWNYKYYIIIETLNNSNNKQAIGLGFKSIKMKNSLLSDYYDIESDISFDSILDNPNKIELLCSDGLTHDPEFNQFIEDYKENNFKKRNMILLQIMQSNDVFEKRIKYNYKTIKNIEFSWMLQDIDLVKFKLNGFDSMYNEIVIENILFESQSINILKMTEELSERKATEAVSRLF